MNLLPRDLQSVVATYLTYNDIKSLCHVITCDDQFWKYQLDKYPDIEEAPEQNMENQYIATEARALYRKGTFYQYHLDQVPEVKDTIDQIHKVREELRRLENFKDSLIDKYRDQATQLFAESTRLKDLLYSKVGSYMYYDIPTNQESIDDIEEIKDGPELRSYLEKYYKVKLFPHYLIGH